MKNEIIIFSLMLIIVASGCTDFMPAEDDIQEGASCGIVRPEPGEISPCDEVPSVLGTEKHGEEA